MGRGEKNTNCTNHTNICFRRQVLKQVKMQTTSAPIHCLYAAKAVPMNGVPSSNADIAAFRRLPENVLPQWQQKIAQMRRK